MAMRAILSCYVLCAVVLAVLALTVTAAPGRPNLPTAYRATFSSYLVFTPDFNLTTTNGVFAASKDLEAYAQTGVIYGVNATTINLFKQHVSYTFILSASSSCTKRTLATDYSGADPLQLIRFTSFAGLVTVRGIQTQVWLIQTNDMSVAVYVTNTARQTPVRLFINTAGYGLQIDYTSFTAGSSARDFQPPKSCSLAAAGSTQRRGLDALYEATARVESFGELEAASVAVLHSALSNMH